jgi:hypothetical protein
MPGWNSLLQEHTCGNCAHTLSPCALCIANSCTSSSAVQKVCSSLCQRLIMRAAAPPVLLPQESQQPSQLPLWPGARLLGDRLRHPVYQINMLRGDADLQHGITLPTYKTWCAHHVHLKGCSSRQEHGIFPCAATPSRALRARLLEEPLPALLAPQAAGQSGLPGAPPPYLWQPAHVISSRRASSQQADFHRSRRSINKATRYHSTVL